MRPTAYKSKVKQKSKKIITGVTASQAIIDYAISQNADAILVHHGYFWKSESPCIRGMKGKRIKALLLNDMNLIWLSLAIRCAPRIRQQCTISQTARH